MVPTSGSVGVLPQPGRIRIGGDVSTTKHGEADYFATSGPTSDIDAHADRLAALPAEPAALGQIVRGLLMHNWTAEVSGITSSPERDGMRTFGAGPTIERIIDLDGSPLDQARPPEERLIGYCYHFALVHCALLRANGVPSRTRCGFANYLADGKWTDHWVVEYSNGTEWSLIDPQIGLDHLSHDDFRDGVRAWQLCRAGDADPFDHGIGDLWGWDELRGSLVNDLGSLNKIEIGDWDWCELLQVEPLDQPHADVDTHLDGVCALAAPGRPLADLHAAFDRDKSIRPPDEIIRGASRH